MNVIKKIFFIALMIWVLWTVFSFGMTGKISTEGARIRREPNTTSDVLTIVYSGETVETLEKQGEWYKVKYGENIGYIREDLILVDEEAKNNLNSEEIPPVQTERQPENITTENKEQMQEFIEVEKKLRKDTIAKVIPNLSASKISELKQDDKVVVIQEMNKWSCIKIDGKTGWVLTATLQDIKPNEQVSKDIEPKIETKTMYISVSAAVLRVGPGTSYDPILEMYRGKTVEILSEDGEWCKIKYMDKEGYVAKRLLTEKIEETHRSLITDRREVPTVIIEKEIDNTEDVKESEESVEHLSEQSVNNTKTIGQDVVEYAKKFLGCRYVYGGVGPNSFDCSGFTKYVYGHFGISLAHNAVVQANNGAYIEKSNLQLGDLVIFKDWNNTSIGHCGIYIGGGQFIHAANAKRGIVTDTLNTGYYYERYVSARRLI